MNESRVEVGASAREGILLGIGIGSLTWLWVVAVDVVTGRPFHTLTALGGVPVFTSVHFTLNITYALVVVAAVRAAERTPSLIIALIFGLVMVEIAFAMLSVIVAQAGVGPLAWVQIFGGSLLGLTALLIHLGSRYPVRALLQAAEEER